MHILTYILFWIRSHTHIQEKTCLIKCDICLACFRYVFSDKVSKREHEKGRIREEKKMNVEKENTGKAHKNQNYTFPI